MDNVLIINLPSCSGCARVPDYTCDLEISDEFPRSQLLITQVPARDTLLPIGVHDLTITVTDPNGNRTICTKQILVQCQQTFLNTEQTAECPEGETGDSVTVVAGQYSSTVSQADADAQALAAAEAQLECCDECPECPDTVPPLFGALYESSRGVIYGVNQGRIYKIDATTGELISQARLREDVMGQNFIVYLSTTDRLYVTVWGLKTEFDFRNPASSNSNGEKLIIEVNPDTLAVTNSFNICAAAALNFASLNSNQPGQITADPTNGLIYGLQYPEGNSTYNPWKLNPLTGIFTIGSTFPTYGDGATHAYVPERSFIDPDTGRMWVSFVSAAPPVGIMARSLRIPQLDAVGVVNVGIGDAADSSHAVPVATAMVYRSSYLYFTIGHSVAQSMTYSGRYVIKKKSDNSGSRTVIDTGRANARPFNIRYNSVNDRIYVPTWPDDTVVIIDPASDTVESVKTGFDSPWDVVFTPTKKWAVQLATPGLKEIT